MRPLITSWIFLVAALCLGGCGDSTSVEAPAGAEEEIQGVSLEQPVLDEPAEGSDGGAAETNTQQIGGEAIQSMAKDVLGVSVTGIDDLGADGIDVEEGVRPIAWRDLSMEGEPIEDILDKLLYPDQYEEGEYNLPDYITELDGQEVAIVGYQIPLEWEGTTVPEFMLVGDLLGCCFGGAPMPDEWINVKMKGVGSEYYPYIPVIVTGTLRVDGIEDEAGYAAGCYHIDGVEVKKEL